MWAGQESKILSQATSHSVSPTATHTRIPADYLNINQANPEDLKELKLKEDKKGKCFYADGLSKHTVVSYTRVKKLIEIGSHYRTKANPLALY